MKKCPICGSIAFDDARVCYGCLHRFDKEPLVEEEDQSFRRAHALSVDIASAEIAPDGMSMRIRFEYPLTVVHRSEPSSEKA